MRTKALLLGAAIGAIGLATSMAQVYSVNIVGYVNTTLPAGKFKLIQNPLKCTLAGGNTLANIIPNTSPAISVDSVIKLYRWDPDKVGGPGYQLNAGYYDDTAQALAWDVPGMVLNPGEGFFLQNSDPQTVTITFVGEVVTGTGLRNPMKGGYNMVGSIVPQAGTLQTDLGYNPQLGYDPALGDTIVEKIYQWDTTKGTKGGYNIFTWYNGPSGGWDPYEPNLAVGEAVYIYRPQGSAISWTRDFTVQ